MKIKVLPFRQVPKYSWIGLGIMLISELLMFARVSLICTFFTPIMWIGYILFIDGINFKISGDSYITCRKKEFIFMIFWSDLCWWIFEFYNVFLKNWYYIGLPDNFIIRHIGYNVSFATIFPGILETSELIDNLKWFQNIKMKPVRIINKRLNILILLGIISVIYPLIFPSPYIFGIVWLGFIFLLEPLNYKLNGRSLINEWKVGIFSKTVSLIFSGAICGFLWEFWNYWTTTKWLYTVPILPNIKIFEMPILGFLGFLPFAIECYALQNIVVALIPKLKSDRYNNV